MSIRVSLHPSYQYFQCQGLLRYVLQVCKLVLGIAICMTCRYATLPFFIVFLVAIVLGIAIYILDKPWKLPCSRSFLVFLKGLPSLAV